MSIKTLRKRIALVAVSALTAGVLSVASAPVANSSSTFTTVEGTPAIVSPVGACTVTNDAGTVIASTTYDAADGSEAIQGNSAGRNVVMPVGATFKLGLHAADNVRLTGPIAVINLESDGDDAALTQALNASGEVYLDGAATDEEVLITALAVGSATLVQSVGAVTTFTSTRANTINITIVAACVTGTVSDTYTVSQATTLTAIAAGAVVRGADVTTIAAGEPVSITAVVKNAYNSAVAADTFTVTATNGALVNIDGSAISLTTSDTKGTTSFDSAASVDGTDVFVRVDNPTGAALTTVVTISYAGQPVAVKTLTWRGEATKINIVGKAVGKTSGKGQIHYTLTDAAGNLTAGSVSGLVTSFGAIVTSTSDTTNTGTATQPTFATTGKGASFASAAQVTENVNSVPMGSVITSATYGIAVFNCGSSAGTADVTLRYYQPVTGAYISTPVSVSCAGGVDTYTVSSDKAAYKIGEVATFTITAKDSKGNPVHDYLNTANAALTTGTATADISIGGGTITKAAGVSDPIGALAGNASGTATFKAQLTTAGSFNTVVNIPGSTTKSVTVAYTVSGGDASNAEVLKSIVALIASINKQIQALQKLILKR